MDPAILETTTQLEATLTDGVAAFREGETRATFELAHELANTRHELLVLGGYVYDRGRYAGTLKDRETQQYPGTSSKDLLQKVIDALTNKDNRLVFRQGDEDSRTDQRRRHLTAAMKILALEVTPHGAPERTDPLFGPTRGTLQRDNYYPTGAVRSG